MNLPCTFKMCPRLLHFTLLIKSKNHNLGTYKTNEISLSCHDDKRYILKNVINELVYGHKNI